MLTHTPGNSERVFGKRINPGIKNQPKKKKKEAYELGGKKVANENIKEVVTASWSRFEVSYKQQEIDSERVKS